METEKEMLVQRGYISPHLVGSGAFANVYRAWDAAGGRYAACKVSRRQRLLEREAAYMERIEHPLFVKKYAFFAEGEYAVLVMEYVWGETLEHMLARRGGFTARRSVEVALTLADGLRYLHEKPQPLIFRDVKPANIIVRQDGAVKLLDLGAAGEMYDRAVAGSRGYAAPEQLLGNAPAGSYSDVYGLGRVLQRMLCAEQRTGEMHTRSHHAEEMRAQRRRAERLLAVAEHCVRAEIGDRIPDMRYLMSALGAASSQRSGGRGDALQNYICEKNICTY